MYGISFFTNAKNAKSTESLHPPPPSSDLPQENQYKSLPQTFGL